MRYIKYFSRSLQKAYHFTVVQWLSSLPSVREVSGMQIPTLLKLLHLASVLVFCLVYWFLLAVFLQLGEVLRHVYFQFYMSHRDMNFEVKIYRPQIQKQNQSISRLNLAKKLLTIWYGPESVEWDVSRASGVHIFPVFLNFSYIPLYSL